MPRTVNGWIEFSTYHSEADRANKFAWQVWMDLSSVLLFNSHFNWKIIGYPNIGVDNTTFQPIALDRGAPLYPSDSLRDDLVALKPLIISGEVYGLTHFSYEEANNIDWSPVIEQEFEEKEWLLLFDLIEHFMEIRNLSPDQIRITAWYVH